jgi:hypothetical protein
MTTTITPAHTIPREFTDLASLIEELARETFESDLVGFVNIEVHVAVRSDLKFVLAITENGLPLPASFGGTSIAIHPTDTEQWLMELLFAKEVAFLNTWRADQS